MMYCRKCGTACKSGARFCAKCGAPLEQQGASGGGKKNGGSKKLLILLVVLMALILVLGGTIAVQLFKNRSDRGNGDTASAGVKSFVESAENSAGASADGSGNPGTEQPGTEQSGTDPEQPGTNPDQPDSDPQSPSGGSEETSQIPEDLVRDYYTFVRSDVVPGIEDWENDEYHIPEIVLSSKDVAKINQEVQDAYLADAQTRAANPDADYGDWEWAKVTYQWAVNGDVLSLVVKGQSEYSDYVEYQVYNVSVSGGTRLSDAQVVDAAGWTQEDYSRAVREALLSRYWDVSGLILEQGADSGMISELKTLFDLTISFCKEAKPFLSETGDLMIAGQYGVPAGGGVASCLINLENYALSPYYSEEFQIPETDSDRLELYRQYMRAYGPGDGFSVLHCLTADVTRDGQPELILVEQKGDEYRGRVYRPYFDGSLLVLQELSGATSHVGGFFGWYLRKNGDGYDLVKENFNMWQGYGSCILSVYYLTEDGDVVSVESYAAESHGDDRVADEDMDAYRKNVSRVLHQSMLLGYDTSEGDGQHLEIDESLILDY